MGDFTEKEIIVACRMVGNGATWEQTACELFPDTEYPELLAVVLQGTAHSWYKRQTPQALMELLKLGDAE